MKRDPRRTMTVIQQEWIDTVFAARQRWSHRPEGGQSHRTIRAATKRFRREMAAWGYNAQWIEGRLEEARDMLALEENATAE